MSATNYGTLISWCRLPARPKNDSGPNCPNRQSDQIRPRSCTDETCMPCKLFSPCVLVKGIERYNASHHDEVGTAIVESLTRFGELANIYCYPASANETEARVRFKNKEAAERAVEDFKKHGVREPLCGLGGNIKLCYPPGYPQQYYQPEDRVSESLAILSL